MPKNPFELTAEDYAAAFREVADQITRKQREILRAHFRSPSRTATARQLAKKVGYQSNSPVNRQYGELGKMLCGVLGIELRTYLTILVISDTKAKPEHPLTLWDEAVKALQSLGWFEDLVEASPVGEAPPSEALEGTIRERLTKDRSRDAALRDQKLAQAIKLGGGRVSCEVPGCGFDFESVYGEIGRHFMHVHHKRPLGARAEAEVTSLADLAVVCANCHAMIHRDGGCRRLEELIVRR